MDTNTRKMETLERAAAFACVLLLAGSSLQALGRDGTPPRRRDPVRDSQLRTMDVFLANYGSADFSAVQDALKASPADAGNPEILTIALSLGNDYLGRYERFRTPADLVRALEAFESVAVRRDLWGGRARSGAVVAYLDMSVVRVTGECDVSGFQDRIDALWRNAILLTAEEAAAASDVEGSSDQSGSSAAEDNAARAALYVWATSLLSDDPRAEQWRANAGRIIAGFSVDDCQSDETVLSLSQATLAYDLYGREVPQELRKSGASRARKVFSACSSSVAVYQTTGPVSVVEPGETLATALHDSRVVELYLSGLFLEQYPPGSQCVDDEEDGGKWAMPI